MRSSLRMYHGWSIEKKRSLEKKRRKIKNYKGYTIKSMIITVTDITAYSVSISNHEKLKDTITMEEIYEDFRKVRK